MHGLMVVGLMWGLSLDYRALIGEELLFFVGVVVLSMSMIHSDG